MPNPKDKEPRYGLPGEDGFHPDELPPEEIIDEIPTEYIEVHGLTPTIILGKPFERIPGEIQIGTSETVDLPPETRFTAKVIEQGLDGEFHERPATSSEIGGGLQITSPEKIEQDVITLKKRTHKKSSRKLLF